MSIRIEQEGDALEVVVDDITEFARHFEERLSKEGVFLETFLRPNRGRELVLTLRLDDGFILLQALTMVAWRRPARKGSMLREGVALHFLKVLTGEDFLSRFVKERRTDGGEVFSIDREAPLTEDGSPVREDAIDQMMARRGARSATEELGSVQREAEEQGPSREFAPGFGQADHWDKDLPPTVPGEVNEWLQQARDESEPAAETPQPQPPPPSRSDDASELAASPPKRTGPVRMKMPADRQPRSPAPSRPTESKSSNSFLAASMKASELLARPKPKIETGPAQGSGASATDDNTQRSLETQSKGNEGRGTSAEALATVAIRPKELAAALEEAERKNREAPASTGQDPAPSTRGAGDSSTADPGEAQQKEELRFDGEVLQDTPLANVDSLESAHSAFDFGYPSEDRRPILIIGLVVVLIIAGLIVWSLLGQ